MGILAVLVVVVVVVVIVVLVLAVFVVVVVDPNMASPTVWVAIVGATTTPSTIVRKNIIPMRIMAGVDSVVVLGVLVVLVLVQTIDALTER